MKAQYIVAWLRHHNLAFVTAVNELMTRNSPPKLGGEPARTKSEQAGWFPCRYWQLREPPRPRLRSGTPPNLGGECPHSNSFTAPMTAGNTTICEIAGGPRSASAKARSLNDRPPLQWPFSTFCAKPIHLPDSVRIIFDKM